MKNLSKKNRAMSKALVCRFTSLLGALFIALFANMASAGPITISGPSGQIIDQNAVGVPYTVSLSTLETGTITDLNVSVSLVPSPYAAQGTDLPWDDLDIFIAHNGVQVQLHESITNAGPNYGVEFDVMFDDEALTSLADLIASSSIPPLPNAIGPYAPNGGGALSDFDGMSLAGQWDLIFVENCCSWETTLAEWSITAEVADVPEPASWALLLAGLGVLRTRRNRTFANQTER